jgi:hypothetical protein
LRFSGVIKEDADRDGYAETRTEYRDGMITGYVYDADQDGLPELDVSFLFGEPYQAELVVQSESGWAGAFAFPVTDQDRTKALLYWEQYPSLRRAELDGTVYTPRLDEFLFSPIGFTELASDGPLAFLYPRLDSLGLTRRTLVSFSVRIERPSAEIPGAVEVIDLDRGIPAGAEERLDGKLVSVTVFRAGRPFVQYIDLDADGRMETIRRFRQDYGPEDDLSLNRQRIPEYSESDWDGDGIYETGEEYLPNGDIIRSWDMDGDGVKEYSEISTEGEG